MRYFLDTSALVKVHKEAGTVKVLNIYTVEQNH